MSPTTRSQVTEQPSSRCAACWRRSGGHHARRDKFPRAILPRTFDFGFATGLMVKDLRLCLHEAAELGLGLPVSEAVGQC